MCLQKVSEMQDPELGTMTLPERPGGGGTPRKALQLRALSKLTMHVEYTMLSPESSSAAEPAIHLSLHAC